MWIFRFFFMSYIFPCYSYLLFAVLAYFEKRCEKIRDLIKKTKTCILRELKTWEKKKAGLDLASLDGEEAPWGKHQV